MNTEGFNRNHVEDSLENIFETMMIDLSKENPKTFKTKLKGIVFKEFSLFEHVVFLIQRLVKCF